MLRLTAWQNRAGPPAPDTGALTSWALHSVEATHGT